MYAVSLLCPEDTFLVSATASYPLLIAPLNAPLPAFPAVDALTFLSLPLVTEFLFYQEAELHSYFILTPCALKFHALVLVWIQGRTISF